MTLLRAPLFVLAGMAALLSALDPRTASADAAPTEKEKPTAAESQFEVRFVNDSVVVMALLPEKVEIQTDYGLLTVPVKDLRRVEFGVHFSDDDRRRVDDAIGRLGAKAFQDREQAVRDLVALGPHAYLRLQGKELSADAESAQRREAAMKKIRQKYPKRVLRTQTEDVVRAAKFTIVGHVVTPTLRARAEDFGELELRPSRLLSIRAVGGEERKALVIDAATYAEQGGRRWLDTGVDVGSHRGLRIVAAGQVDTWLQQPGQYMVGPDGAGANMGMGWNRNGRTGGELLGRIGDDGPVFVVGSKYTRTPKEEGRLYLQIVPSPWNCPSTGEYRVEIETGSFPEDGSD